MSDSTTMIIRRRVRHWKTTIAGVVAIFSPIAIAIFPKHALLISSITSAAVGSGLLAAADAKPGQGRE